jgi:hypothetical protein
LRRPLSPRIENWTGAPCGPFCGRRTSGWRTSFDCFERAGRRLCLPGRALAAAPASQFTALPALFDAFRDPFTSGPLAGAVTPASWPSLPGCGAKRPCRSSGLRRGCRPARPKGPSPCSLIWLRAKTNAKPQEPSNHAPSSNSKLRVDPVMSPRPCHRSQCPPATAVPPHSPNGHAQALSPRAGAGSRRLPRGHTRPPTADSSRSDLPTAPNTERRHLGESNHFLLLLL